MAVTMFSPSSDPRTSLIPSPPPRPLSRESRDKSHVKGRREGFSPASLIGLSVLSLVTPTPELEQFLVRFLGLVDLGKFPK